MSNVATHQPVLELFEGQTAFFMARLIGLSGALLTIATTSAISWTAFDLSSPTSNVQIANGTALAANSIFNTPTNLNWPFPDGGANFMVPIVSGGGAGQIPWKGLHRYRVRFTVTHTLVSGPASNLPDGPFKFEYEVVVHPGFEA